MPNAAERARNAYLHRASRKRRHARVIQQMGGVCVRCGNIRDLQIHHKIPVLCRRNHRCGDTNMQDACRDPGAVEVLCRICNLRTERAYQREHRSAAESNPVPFEETA